MQHLLRKKSFQGAGWFSKPKIPKPKPSILRPPNLGKYKALQSYSVAEVIDLISDGPIEGLVNQNGQLLDDGNILQGIYLDNTPVQTTSNNTFEEIKNSLGSTNISTTLNLFGKLFFENKSPKLLSYDATPEKTPQPASAEGLFKFQAERLIFYARTWDYWGTFRLGTWEKKRKAREYSSFVDFKKQQPIYVLTENGVVEMPSDFTAYNPYLAANGWSIDNYLVKHNSNNLELITAYYPSFKITTARLNLFSKKTEDYEFKSIIKSMLDDVGTELTNKINNSSINSYEKEFLKKNIERYNLLIDKIRTGVDSFGEGNSKAYLCCRIKDLKLNNCENKTIFKTDESGKLTTIIDNFYFDLPFEKISDQINYILTPGINANGTFTGVFYGCIVFELPLLSRQEKQRAAKKDYKDRYIDYYVWKWTFGKVVERFADSNIDLKFVRGVKNYQQADIINKYNFNNISAQFKIGDEQQTPLADFENIYVDYEYGSALTGPFNLLETAQRLGPIENTDVATPPLIGSVQGSVDNRSKENFSQWNDFNSFNEIAVPFTHTIENPNVESVFFTLGIEELSDTIDIDEGTGEKARKIGEKRPAIVNIEVRIGITRNGDTVITTTKKYAIIALVEGIMLIDFGCPELYLASKTLTPIRDLEGGGNKDANLSIPFELPKIDVNEDTSKTKRFIKIIKLSGETNSVLIKKEINVAKVTEIIKNKLSFPFSAVAGLKLDSRSFGNAPDRTYDCRLKKIKIPTNYYPLDYSEFNVDKRYIQKKSDYKNNNLIYEGDWDGNFKIGWTDNPAWVMYDLLTNPRYGLGRYLDESQINKWELYKIGRFCDAVDENGYFVGVADGAGGLEPRYSCNILFKEATKIYDSIVSVANLFRGGVYFTNSEINFLDDRPRTPIMTFYNTNVKDGIFNYSNIRKDQQYNTIEVAYLDRFDNFQNKIEYVEDEQDIRKRGIFKSKIESFGVTSRAMARRMGQHMIYQTIKENQTVEFIAGLEALLCRPGDLIIIEDDLKTRAKNFGRILEVDTTQKTLFLEGSYSQAEYNGTITAYIPTGNSTAEDLEILSTSPRYRLEYFNVTGNLIDTSDSILTGRYYFDSYAEYIIDGDKSFYPLYTGRAAAGHKIFCYYNTGVKGFVFSTGLAYQDNNTYDKVITNTGIIKISQIIADLSQQSDGYGFWRNIYRYSATNPYKQGAAATSYNKLSKDQNHDYFGILESEINTVNYPQITKFYITGFDNLDYGSKVYLDQTKANTNLISNVKAGSPYRLGRLNASDQIYKVLAIKEENQNEYVVAASKYDTGKFIQIEDFTAEDFLSDTYYSGSSKIGSVSVSKLSSPVINVFTTGSAGINGFSLSGSWQAVNGATKYQYNIYNEILNISYLSETTSTSVMVNNITDLGDWKLDLRSIATAAGKINSDLSRTGIFVAYYNSAITPLTRAAVLNFKII